MSWSFDVSPSPLPPGHVTGDFITMLAVAWSLVRQQQADAFDVLDCLASSYSPGTPARYSPYNALALEGLSEGVLFLLLCNSVLLGVTRLLPVEFVPVRVSYMWLRWLSMHSTLHYSATCCQAVANVNTLLPCLRFWSPVRAAMCRYQPLSACQAC
jgi:hypothetical protein